MKLEKVDLPKWLKDEVVSVQANTASKFLNKNLETLQMLLQHFNKPKVVQQIQRNSWSEVIDMLVWIVLTVVNRQFIFLQVLALILLINIVRMPSMQLVLYVKALAKLIFFSLIIGLPSIFFISYQAMLLWIFKIVLIMSIVQFFRQKMTWINILIGMRQLHLPSLFILTLDVTVKYSHVLGEHLQETLQAIQLRSYGPPVHPLHLTGRILGRLFLISRCEAEMLYMAMSLRCYRGKSIKYKSKICAKDVQLLLLDALLIMFLFILGG